MYLRADFGDVGVSKSVRFIENFDAVWTEAMLVSSGIRFLFFPLQREEWHDLL